MAIQSEHTATRTQDLSTETGIPMHYLSKIMRRLVTEGLLKSQKGHGGGFVFARDISEIYLADILRVFNPKVDEEACVFGRETCDSENPCILHDFWDDLQGSINTWSEKYTLRDVANRVGILNERPGSDLREK